MSTNRIMSSVKEMSVTFSLIDILLGMIASQNPPQYQPVQKICAKIIVNVLAFVIPQWYFIVYL